LPNKWRNVKHVISFNNTQQNNFRFVRPLEIYD
jgi:hypothetical protein